jgi:hypothetical protein
MTSRCIRLAAIGALALGVLALPALALSTHAESIKVGLSRFLGYPAVPIGIDRGCFEADIIDPRYAILIPNP